MTLGSPPCSQSVGDFGQRVLFNLGFAFGSPASSSVVTMVYRRKSWPPQHVGSLHINIGGVIGPLIGAFLIPIVGASVVFGINGLGFLFLFLAILRWKQPRKQTDLPLEDFFTTLTMPINYALRVWRKVIVMRHIVFSFFILPSSNFLIVVGVIACISIRPTSAIYSRHALSIVPVGAMFVTSWARARFSPNKLTICANLLLVPSASYGVR